jgi:hypothetical protein
MVEMAWFTGPIPIIEQAIEDRDWFKAIVFSAIQLERHGYLAIKEYLENLNVDSDLIEKILERIHLYKIAECLLIIKRIDGEEFETIKKLNEERNNFMHRRETKRFAWGKQADKKYQPLALEAIRILREKLNVVRLVVSKG